ncbi:ATP-binding cassette domain-containing protein [Rhodobacteraceae bacterium 2CG4]|uniref:ATP-binding cassette domain-containing protein n=1 Tax=Halovulum marinum TaxID=2662447 RepID=A0A6L5YZ62_9RHOB|nr:ABC transporter ATP-binding protein [Halovulum marinum]MSU89152.1 ATP-binding cassette domain-containing protein [Halovulum marinum]
MPDGAAPILEVRDLAAVYRTRDAVVHAVNGVSFTLGRGEVLGLVGESGAGKSAAMLALLGLLPARSASVVGGQVLFDGDDLLRATPERLRRLRGSEFGYVFQDPATSLNPVLSIGHQLAEPLRVHRGLSRRAARAGAAELLALVGIPDPKRRLEQYPHQFSGGQRQRVMIAMALACKPRVLIADEPTTALDVTVQAQILELLRDLRRQLGMAVIWITHDLGVIAGIADRVIVMYAGRIVEQAPVRALFADPRHPYTRALLAALPRPDGPREARLRAIPGQPPRLETLTGDCPFRPRCARAFDRCAGPRPELRPVGPEHRAACHLVPDPAETAHA